MEGFNVVDAVVAVIIVLSSLLAYSRGLVREAMAIAGWVAAAIVAFVFAPNVMPLIEEIPMIGPILADSCELSIIASFAAVFAITLMIVSFFTPLLSSLINKSVLGRWIRSWALSLVFCAASPLSRLPFSPIARS